MNASKVRYTDKMFYKLDWEGSIQPESGDVQQFELVFTLNLHSKGLPGLER